MDPRLTFVLANEFKEGDQLVGGGDDADVREDARRSLGALRLGGVVSAAFAHDGVTEALERSLNAQLLVEVSGLTVAEVKQILLSPAGAGWIRRYRGGLRSEVIAAGVKVMSDSVGSTGNLSFFNPQPSL